MRRELSKWEHAGLECHTMSGPMSINGYVDLPPGHPAHGKHYAAIDVDVHGGLTYAEGEGKVWQVGFDTAHYGSGHWSEEMVREETNRLAEQLASKAEKSELSASNRDPDVSQPA